MIQSSWLKKRDTGSLPQANLSIPTHDQLSEELRAAWITAVLETDPDADKYKDEIEKLQPAADQFYTDLDKIKEALGE